jgi:hypothetical protein
MPSKGRAEPLDSFERDVPVSAEDNEALWRVRAFNVMDPYEYLAFLLAFTKDEPPSREINTDSEPFTL